MKGMYVHCGEEVLASPAIRPRGGLPRSFQAALDINNVKLASSQGVPRRRFPKILVVRQGKSVRPELRMRRACHVDVELLRPWKPCSDP